MPKYVVTIKLAGFVYEIDAENEDEALDKADTWVRDETMHDLMKGSEFSIEQEETTQCPRCEQDVPEDEMSGSQGGRIVCDGCSEVA